MKRPIANNSSPGQAVYDPFVGSGTTIIAADMTGRACHAIEIDPVYVDVAITRWQNFTGAQAVHQNGRAFVAAGRTGGCEVSPKKLPTHLKLLRGNPGKRPLPPEPEFDAAPDIPEPPAFLMRCSEGRVAAHCCRPISHGPAIRGR